MGPGFQEAGSSTGPGIARRRIGLKGERCLIAVIDDDSFVRRALARFLASSGLDVATFPSAIAFLESPHVRPMCLVTDIQMPGMSGLELKQQLANSARDLPVIFITAHDDPRNRALARTLGAAGYFEKPFDGAALLEAILKAIGNDLDD